MKLFGIKKYILVGILQLFIITLVSGQVLDIADKETDKTHFVYGEEPLVSYGGGWDFIFYVEKEDWEYETWANWASEHGINHLRAYLPWSYKYMELSYERCNGEVDLNMEFPYHEDPSSLPNNRKFDLTKFNDNWWEKFEAKISYLEKKGIIIHLLMVNGWQSWNANNDFDDSNWGGHFFNPVNNVNAFTSHLSDDLYSENNRKKIYSSVADGETILAEIQRDWYRKIIKHTKNYGNVYYDLVHESYGRYENWDKFVKWVNEMSQTIRDEWEILGNKRPLILGMDAGGFDTDLDPINNNYDNELDILPVVGSEVDWIFKQDYFDIIIWGKVHYVDIISEIRKSYKKPYIPQESWDEDATKYRFNVHDNAISARKYFWKLMMHKVQQMDYYYREASSLGSTPPNDWEINDHPSESGNPIETWSPHLRTFFDGITDYANLLEHGEISSGNGDQKYVLSSSNEAIAYLSSETGSENIHFPGSTLQIDNTLLSDGNYSVTVFSPIDGLISHNDSTIASNHTIEVELGNYTDDIAVRFTKISGDYLNINSSSETVPGTSGSKTFTIISNIAWSTSTSDSWLIVSPNSGNNDSTFTVNYTRNSGTGSRTGTITVTGGEFTKTLSITQSVAFSPAIINDDLLGSTLGTIVGGNITSEGYIPGPGNNHILYQPSSTPQNGYVQFDVKGFDITSLGSGDEHAFIAMYDGRGIREPIQYMCDFRNNFFRWNLHWREERDAFKMHVNNAVPTSARKNLSSAVFPGCTNGVSDWTGALTGAKFNYNKNEWYTIKLEWNNSVHTVYVNDELQVAAKSQYNYLPDDFKIWLGSGPGKYDADIGNVIYRNFKIIDLDAENGSFSEDSHDRQNNIQEEKNIPSEYILKQNYPNPFNPTTLISFEIPNDDDVKLEIFNILGEIKATLVDRKVNAGYHEVSFDASKLISGVYIYRIQTSNFIEAKKMILIK